MTNGGLSPTEWRLIIALIGIAVLGLIYWFGISNKPEQGSRKVPRNFGRREPTLDASADPDADAGDAASFSAGDGYDEPEQGELDVGDRPPPASSSRRRHGPLPGQRPADLEVERIVSVFVTHRDNEPPFAGADIVVAAEKAGLDYGAMDIFHRTVEHSDRFGPVFSVANMVKPGSFDMRTIGQLETPGLSLFMTLPGPLPALDAWDAMLPTAQRLAELLGGQVLDEQHNALGRQRVAYIRDELRAWDRRHDGDEIR